MNNELLQAAKRLKVIFFDFDGVFTDNRVLIDENGHEYVFCNRSDGIGCSKIKFLGIEPVIVSSEPNPVVLSRAKKLNVQCFNSVKDKAECIRNFTSRNSLKLDECAFVGNDVNDIGALKIVGLPITVADAYPEVKDVALFVASKKGGQGVVREICDLIYSLCTEQSSTTSINSKEVGK